MRNAIAGSGVPPMLGNAGPRITSSIGNLVSGGNIGRGLSSGGGLAMPGLASHLSLISNGSGNMNVQGSNRLMGGILSQGSLHLHALEKGNLNPIEVLLG